MDFVRIDKDGAIATLTLNKPEERNALSTPAQWAEVVAACDAVRADYAIKVVILTGAGSAFCAGGNVKDMRDKTGIAAGSPREIADGYRAGIQRIPLALYNLEVPTIAAVNGPAIGAGCDLACMCDIRIASSRARFAESFVKLGLIPGDGGAWLLPRAVGMSKAAELTFTGDTIGADEALACGLVSRVVAPEELLGAARELAARIAANPAPALRMAKRLLREGQHVRLDTLLEMSAAFQAVAHHTPEHDAALAAFLAKK
ncbi:MAG: crotonase/enoyl-CoA hydratase family protein [Burkholderiales bacterium]|nr:crotonase/enoyl-CoA hydratase family protein [Burkholderiales bacterium]